VVADQQLPPTLVKIDVDGAELDVLHGATDTLRNHSPAILLELHTDLLEQRGHDPAEVTGLLKRLGYVFYDVGGRRVTAAKVAKSVNAVVRVLARTS
jgi:hypothetical protein